MCVGRRRWEEMLQREDSTVFRHKLASLLESRADVSLSFSALPPLFCSLSVPDNTTVEDIRLLFQRFGGM